MAAITAAVAIGAAGASSAMASRGARKARRDIREGTARAEGHLDEAYQDQQNYLDPYLQMGMRATGDLEDPTNSFYASPDYEFRRSEGLRDTGNMFNMRGGGGNAMKGITDFASNLASGEFGNWFGRTFAQAGMGQQSAQDLAGLAGNRGNIKAGMHFQGGRHMADIAGQKYTNIGNSINNLGENLMGIYGAKKPKG